MHQMCVNRNDVYCAWTNWNYASFSALIFTLFGVNAMGLKLLIACFSPILCLFIILWIWIYCFISFLHTIKKLILCRESFTSATVYCNKLFSTEQNQFERSRANRGAAEAKQLDHRQSTSHRRLLTLSVRRSSPHLTNLKNTFCV